jgi:iron complex outermembrane receptor protein
LISVNIIPISLPVQPGFCAEYRTENFEIFSEEGSYALYDTNGVAITNPAIQVPLSIPTEKYYREDRRVFRLHPVG